jgi:hypothetical protein
MLRQSKRWGRRSIPGLGGFVVVLGIYLSIIVISVVIYTGLEVIANIISLHIIESAVVDSKVVRGVKSA